MVHTPTTSLAVAAANPKKTPKAKKGKKAVGKPKAKASRPPTNEMVFTAVKELKQRGGSSLQAIKKYISATYLVDADKMAPFIRKAIKSSVASGAIVQTNGVGASGSFKIPDTEKTKKPATKPKVASPKAAAKPAVKKSQVAKKVTKPKMASAKNTAAKSKLSAEDKETTKTSANKSKSPKLKTVKRAAKSPRKK